MRELRDKGIIIPVIRTNAEGYRHPDLSNYGHVVRYCICRDIWALVELKETGDPPLDRIFASILAWGFSDVRRTTEKRCPRRASGLRRSITKSPWPSEATLTPSGTPRIEGGIRTRPLQAATFLPSDREAAAT